MSNENSGAEAAPDNNVVTFPQSIATPEARKPRSRPAPRSNNEIVTEDSAALEFAERYSGELLFDHDAGAWFRWMGTHWARENTGLAFQWAREQARELAETENPKARFILSKVSFASGVERFCQTDRTFAVLSEAWDANAWQLGTPSGTVDLKTGKLHEARPLERITKTTSVGPAPAANCPLWLRFLAETTGNDAALMQYLQRFCGYALTGDTREHSLIFVYGPGGNGKSVFLNILNSILAGYAVTAPMDTFTASLSDKHPTDLAMLAGARLVTASETEEGRAWAETRIKALTGGDRITARFMRRDFFTFIPRFKLAIIGNHKPVLHNVDDAARRRFHIVPFMHKPATPDPQLEVKLKAEWPGILRWMIDGCLAWQAEGLVRPEVVRAATEQYFGDQDSMQMWLDECCDVEIGNAHKWEKSADLFQSWTAHALRDGEKPGSAKAFAASMQRRGFEPYRITGGTRAYRGLLLKRSDDRRIV